MSESVKVLAFHGQQQIKDQYLARVRAHREADELVSGTGWEQNGKVRGCAVGCTFNAYDHTRGPVEIGYPTDLLFLEDSIFEGLALDNDGAHLSFPEAFLDAAAPGADLSMVLPRFSLWLLAGPETPLTFDADKYPGVAAAVAGVAQLHQEWITTGTRPEAARWSAAESVARNAVRSIAESADECAPRSVAESAAWSAVMSAVRSVTRSGDGCAVRSVAESVTESAAWSAVRSAVRSVARSADGCAPRSVAKRVTECAAWKKMRDKLLALLREAT